jgi:SAM-dependent methyltransferase
MNGFSLRQPWWFTERIIRDALARIADHLTGRVLDVGCGQKRYRDLVRCDEYVGIDNRGGPAVDVVGDAHALPFGDENFDSVLSNQVLEHVRDPSAVVAEVRRILKPGGCFVLSVPFIGRLHGAPHDYWRFSEFGIRELLEAGRFEVISVAPIGGFWTTQAFLWLFYIWEGLQGRGRVGRMLQSLLIPPANLLSALAHALDREELTPHNYVAVGRKGLRTPNSA